MKTNAIIQARCGSTRFPNKVFADINGKPLLWHVVDRLRYTKTIDDIVIATTTNKMDDQIELWATEEGVKCYRGSEDDVLNRYYSASVAFPSDAVVRVTADDPFKEPAVIDKVVNMLWEEKCDLVTNNFPPSFPEGLDCEAFTFETLEKMEQSANDSFEREHVTQYVYHNPSYFKVGNITSDVCLSSYRWTIDTKEDYNMVKAIYEHRIDTNGEILLMDEILQILKRHPEIAKLNDSVKRSAMYQG